jgi:hypothetical protein
VVGAIGAPVQGKQRDHDAADGHAERVLVEPGAIAGANARDRAERSGPDHIREKREAAASLDELALMSLLRLIRHRTRIGRRRAGAAPR